MLRLGWILIVCGLAVAVMLGAWFACLCVLDPTANNPFAGFSFMASICAGLIAVALGSRTVAKELGYCVPPI
jgi:hypothetical protein